MRRLLLLLLFPLITMAQGVPHNIPPVIGSNGQPRPGATVSFCGYPANALPCTNYANAYNDIGMTQLIDQVATPIKTDGLGNVPIFFAAPAIYTYTISGTGINVPNGPYVVSLSSTLNQSLIPNTVVVFNSTPTFAAGTNASYTMTLTGNITLMTITGPPVNGNLLRFRFVQDATGGHTVTWPGNFANPPNVNTAPLFQTQVTWMFDGLNWQLLTDFIDNALDYYPAPAFTATPNFSNSRSAAFDFTLTGNVTSSTFTTPGRAGTIFNLNLCEDGVGGRTFAFPINVTNPPGFSFDTVATHCNYLTYRFNGTNWTPISTGGSGGGGSPGGVAGDLQINNGAFGAGGENDNGTRLLVNRDIIAKGPNPYVDPRAYNVRPIDTRFTPTVPGITGTINSGSASLTVSTSNCANQAGSVCFNNGDGIVVVGAGAAQSMTAPVPTVVASSPSGPTGTVQAVAGPTGATTYNYKIIAVDKGRGMTVPSAATTITNGQATLGAKSVGITSCTRSGQIVNCLTASAHTLVIGAAFNLGQASDGSFSGSYKVATVPDNTHFTYTSGFDTASGASTSSTGGTVRWFVENFITWSHVTNAHQYIVCSDRGGAGYVAIGISKPDNSARTITDMALAFDDLGSPMMDNFQLPFWAGTNPCTAASPQNDELVTTIASGAPGTSFTLAATASTSVTNQIVLFDHAPNFLTAVTAAGNGLLNIPFPNLLNGGYVFNSYMTMPSQYDICQVGVIQINDTIQVTGGQRWAGNCPPVGSSPPAAAWEGYTGVNVGPAYPGFYLPTGLINMQNLQLGASGSFNQKVLALFDPSGVPSGTMTNINFVSGGANSYMDMGLVIRGILTDSPSIITMKGHFLFTGGNGSGAVGSTTTPLFYTDPGWILADNISMTIRGMAIKWPSQPFGFYDEIKTLYMNGGITPLVTVTSGGGSELIHFGMVNIDTVGLPLLVNLDDVGRQTGMVVDDLSLGPSSDGVSVPPLVSGFSTSVIGSPVGTGYVRTASIIRGFGVNNVYSTGTPLVSNFNEGELAVGGTHSIFVSAPAVAAPTGSVTAGGSVPVGNIVYSVVPVWQNGGEGRYSLPATFTTTGGNQTVNLSWTAAPGNPLGYNIYRGSPAASQLLTCGIPTTTTNSYIDTSNTVCGQSGNSVPTGGPTVMMPGVQGMAAPKFQGGGYASTPTSTKTSAYTPTVFDNIIPVSAAGGGFTISLNPAIIGSHWVILRYDNVPANVLTVAPTSGTIDGSASTTLSALSGMIVTCDGVNCHIEGRSSGGGAANINNSTQFSFPYYSAAGLANTLSGIASPTQNSLWKIVYQVTGGVALAPTVALDGIAVIQLTSSAALDYTYRAADVRYSSCTTTTLTLPAISGTTASNLPFTITNGCSGNLTITSTSPNSINGGIAGNSVTIFPGQFARFTQDNTPNWWETSYVTTNGIPTNCTAITNSATLGLVCANLPVVGGTNLQTVNYTALTADDGKTISMNGTTLTLTLPAAAPSATWKIFIENRNASSLTVSRNGLNIDGAASNITVPQNQGLYLTVDQDGVNYSTSRGLSSATAGVSTLTGDGALITNSGSAGPVTLALGNAAAHTVWSRIAGSSGAPAYNTLGTADIPAQALTKLCDIIVGDTSGSAITNAQLGPQKRICQIPKAATVVQITVAADAGTPNVIVGRSRCTTFTAAVCTAETRVNLLSSALAAATGGFDGCSNTGGTTGIDGGTTCSSTLQNTGLNSGDYLELVSGTAGGTAKLMTIHIYGTFN